MITEIKNKKIFSTDVGHDYDSKKPTIILLHGSGQSHVVWSLTDQFLADQGYNVFALDFSYLINASRAINGNNPLANTMRFTLTFDFGQMQNVE